MAHEQLVPQSCSKRICPKQHQLPMFLSKTYHMMDRCDPNIATWSSSGDNFIVKDVELFSTKVLPLYFKHSNFSSFARQLNFYGFRKLRSDPILTSEVDPTTSCFVRFYHDKFQKDKPELLHQIKRATKSSESSSSLSHQQQQQLLQQQHQQQQLQQPSFSNAASGGTCSKDDVDSLRADVTRLRDCMTHLTMDMDRKLIEMSYEYNKRISALSAEYDKLAGLVSQVLCSSNGGGCGGGEGSGGSSSASTSGSHGVGGNDAVAILWASVAAAAAAASGGSGSFSRGTEWIQSLSRVAALREAGGGGLLPPLSSSSTVEDTTTPPTSGCLGSGSACLLGTTSTSKKRAAPAQEDETSSGGSGKRRGLQG